MITNFTINENLKRRYYNLGYWTKDTLGSVWEKRVASSAHKEYVCDDQGMRLTYDEVDKKASSLALWLKSQGIKSGDVVTFQVPTWSEFCIVYIATLKVGAVMHPVPRNFNDFDLIYIMNLVNSKAFICPTRITKTNFEDQILGIMNHISCLKAIALIDKVAPSESSLPTLSEICNIYKYSFGALKVCSDDIACILSTSGTTGKPKAVLLTHNNIIFSETVFTEGAERNDDDIMFMASPLNHATGFFHGLIAPMLLGGRTVLQQDFNPTEAIKIMNAEKCTWSMGATPFIFDILKSLEQDTSLKLDTLKVFLCGGAPVPRKLVEYALRHNILLCESYGSTESCPHVLVPPSKCRAWKGAWSGAALRGISVKIVDNNHREVPYLMQGEEISQGPHQFVGYLNEPERTRKALDSDGWFYSGDLGYMNDKGYLRINGRKKEIIIRGGENICSNEIDDGLIGCPGISETATIGMPDQRLGERICTFAVTFDQKRPTLEEITLFLSSKHVAKRLWPERIEYIDTIPKTSTGKVKRNILANELDRRMKSEQKTSALFA